MKLYHIKDEYINYLKTYDSRVPDNKQETRPYIGVVLDIDGIKYYAPLSSPKPKHLKMKNTLDFRKIDGGRYGGINLNNMIPVLDDVLIEFDINSVSDIKYRNLLIRQQQALNSEELVIKNTAYSLYKLLMKDDSELRNFEITIKNRSCDIKLLESIYKDFGISESY